MCACVLEEGAEVGDLNNKMQSSDKTISTFMSVLCLLLSVRKNRFTQQSNMLVMVTFFSNIDSKLQTL